MPYADPEQQREYHREYARQRRAGVSQTPGQTRLPAEFRLKTAHDVLDLLREQIEAVRNDEDARTLEKARAVGYLASIALRAVEAADMTSRIEAMEAALKSRKDSGS